MTTDIDQARAIDRLVLAMANYARAQREVERRAMDRARAVVDARAAGMSSREIGAVLGISHVMAMNLARLGERAAGPRPTPTDRAEPDPSATGIRGAPEPTPVGVLLARALEIPEEPPAEVVEDLVAAGPRAEPDPSATAHEQACLCAECAGERRNVETCRRVGCREQVAPGLRWCAVHARC